MNVAFYLEIGGMTMELLKKYSKKYGIKEVINDYGEHRYTRKRSIVFPNG